MLKCFPFRCGVKEEEADLILTCSAQALINVKKFKEKGNTCYNTGKYQDAVNEYTKAMAAFTFKKNTKENEIQINDTDASLDTQDAVKLYSTLLSNRSVSYKKIKKYEEAKKDAEQVIDMRPSWFKGYFRKAEALIELREFEEAKKFFTQALNLEPNSHSRISRCIDAVNIQIQNKEMGLVIYQLIPGRDICIKSIKTPIQNFIYPYSYEMQNLMYIIGDEKTRECILVDACWDIDGILRFAKNVNLDVVGAIYTHYHIDHAGGIPPAPYDQYYVRIDGLAKLAKKLPDISIFIHENDFDGLLEANPELQKSRLTFINDNQMLSLPLQKKSNSENVKFQIIHTPGHTLGSICILVNSVRLLSGDTLFNGICGRCDFPDSDKKKMYQSLQQKLQKLNEKIVILPGHNYNGEWTTIAEQKNHGPLEAKDYESWAKKYTGSI